MNANTTKTERIILQRKRNGNFSMSSTVCAQNKPVYILVDISLCEHVTQDL